MKTKSSYIFVSKLKNPYDNSTSLHVVKQGRFTKAEMSVLGKKYKGSNIQFENARDFYEFEDIAKKLSQKFFGQKPKNNYEYVRTTYKDNSWYQNGKKSSVVTKKVGK